MRVFFAIDLPETAKTAVGAFIVQLKKSLKYNNIRWVKAQNLHLTLQFLEKIEEQQVPSLAEAVRHATDQLSSFSLELGKLDVFSSTNRSRIIFLEAGPSETLGGIATALRESIKSAGHPTEMRPFRAHITLGRINFNAVKNFSLPLIELPAFEKILIQEITLFQTVKFPEGSQYQALEHLPLQGAQSAPDPST